MKKIRKISYYIILSGFLFVLSCAQQGAPTGGPEDEDPPVVLKAEPENYSTKFKANKILITFDEYLDMANFTQELVVSPPMEEKPVVKLRNKTLIIEFEEELKEEVTYTFNFGEGIKDLNEKNVLENLEYVFSTGNFLDSLSIKGTLKNAFDLTVPEAPIFVMLYSETGDSLPLVKIPYYVGRTDKEGNFAVNNLKTGTYKLFILKDGNNNFLFDLPSEKIAYLDTTLLVDADFYRSFLLSSGIYDSTDLNPDTLVLGVDTTGMSADSIVMLLDSLEKAKPDFNSIFVDLFMFTEDPVNQFITDYKRQEKRFLNMVFNLPLTDSFSFAPVFPESLKQSDLLVEFGGKRDSVTIWLGDTIVAAKDTIGISVQYTALDTLGVPRSQKDTLQFVYREKSTKKKSTKKPTENSSKALMVNTIAKSGKHHILRDIVLSIDTPLDTIDPALFEMYIIPDSVEIPVKISPFPDTANLHKVRITNKWEEEAQYRMVLFPGAIRDIYGSTNDTIDRKFSIRPIAEYGTINLSVENVSGPLMIEVYKKDAIIRKKAISSSGTYVFDYMDPDTYRIKFVYDRNGNGKWDTGKYMEHRQPEKVEYLIRDLKVRANWDHDIKYVMGTNDSPPKAPDDIATEEGVL